MLLPCSIQENELEQGEGKEWIRNGAGPWDVLPREVTSEPRRTTPINKTRVGGYKGFLLKAGK